MRNISHLKLLIMETFKSKIPVNQMNIRGDSMVNFTKLCGRYSLIYNFQFSIFNFQFSTFTSYPHLTPHTSLLTKFNSVGQSESHQEIIICP